MITDYKTYADAKLNFKWDEIWDFYDGDKNHFNIAHECVDRHPPGDTAVRLQYADGRYEEYTFGELSAVSSKMAHALEKIGVTKGDRVCLIMDPCFEYYAAVFGTLKMGGIIVPCFTGFGRDGLLFRLKDSKSQVVITTEEKAKELDNAFSGKIITLGKAFQEFLANESETYDCRNKTSGKDVAVYQYTSGTTRKFPDAVKQFHKSMAIGLPSTLFNIGLRKEIRYFCPASPAWGHGLWYGTFAPLSLGTAIGAYSGKFDVDLFLKTLERLKIEILSAAPSIFRQIKKLGIIGNYQLNLKQVNYTGEAMDTDTFHFIEDAFGVAPIGGYGSTEVGPLVMDYGGFEDYKPLPGCLGKPMIGVNVAIIDEQGNPVSPGSIGEIAIMRKDGWFRVKDAAIEDENGYYWHKGRVDDVIISSGWTISPTEVEDKLQQHKNVLSAVVVGKPDKDRGQIVKAYLEVDIEPLDALKQELMNFVKYELGKHEYPREIEFVEEIPKTEGGKINRKEVENWAMKEVQS